jgi:hypothetical protein
MPQIADITSLPPTPTWTGPQPLPDSQVDDQPALLRGGSSKDPKKARKKKKWKACKSFASTLIFGKPDKHAARHTPRAQAWETPVPMDARPKAPEMAGESAAETAANMATGSTAESIPESASESASTGRELALVPYRPESFAETAPPKPHQKGIRKKLHKYTRYATDWWEAHNRAEQARKAEKQEAKACKEMEIAEDKAIDAACKFLEALDGVQSALHLPSKRLDKITPKLISHWSADTAGTDLLDTLQKFQLARNITKSTRPDREARQSLIWHAMQKMLSADTSAAASGSPESVRNRHTAIRLAAADIATRDRLIAIVQEKQKHSKDYHIPTQTVNELLDDIVKIGLFQAAFNYQFVPLNSLLELATRNGEAPGRAWAPLDSSPATVIAEQLDLIFRGYNEPGLVTPGETRIAYLERILRKFTDSLRPAMDPDPSAGSEPMTEDESARKEQARQALKALASLFAIGNSARSNALREEILKSATSDALKLQYGNLFDRLSRLIARELKVDHGDRTIAPQRLPARGAGQQPWNGGGPRRRIHPYHQPSRLRRFVRSMWFWSSYLFSDGESCAWKRVEHWQGKVDTQLRGLLKRLGRMRVYDLGGDLGARTQRAMDRDIRRLHDALDCLEAEWRDQNSDWTARAYLVRSLLQRYGEIGSPQLHNAYTIMLEHGWQPQLQPRGAWAVRMARLRDRLHPFRVPADLRAVRNDHPDHATRHAQTWRTMCDTLRAEIMDQTFLGTFQLLAIGMREKKRDVVAQAAKQLAQLDAQCPAETPMTPPEFHRALLHLSNEDLDILDRKLTKYSRNKGRRMEDLLKRDQLKRETIAEDNLFYLGALFERLHGVILTVKQNRSFATPADTLGVTTEQRTSAAGDGNPSATAAIEAPDDRGRIAAAQRPAGLAAISYLEPSDYRYAA